MACRIAGGVPHASARIPRFINDALGSEMCEGGARNTALNRLGRLVARVCLFEPLVVVVVIRAVCVCDGRRITEPVLLMVSEVR